MKNCKALTEWTHSRPSAILSRAVNKVNNTSTKKKMWNLFKVNKKYTVRTTSWCRFAIFIVNFEHISYFFEVFQLLTLNN